MLNLKIIHVTTVHKPTDERIFYKQCLSLVNAGFNISILTKKEESELIKGLDNIAISIPSNTIGRFFSNFIRIPIIIIRKRFNFVHLHDPELIPAGLILKLFGKKVIFDFHELVYFQLDIKKISRISFVKCIIRFTYKTFEGFAVKYFDKLILAEEGYMDYFKKYYYKYQDKISIIRNYPILDIIENVKPAENNYSKPLLIYAGGLSEHRGIFELVEAVGLLTGKVRLLLFGEWDSDLYKNRCMRSQGWKYVHYMGFRPLTEVYSYMKISMLGVALLYPITNYKTSMPVKAYEYMSCKLPMILSNFSTWEEYFKDFAFFSDPYKPGLISQKINYAIDNLDYAKELGLKGYKAIKEKYSWEKEEIELINLYNELV